MKKYNFGEIEKKWQEAWEKEELYRADDKSKREKKYVLIEFPYPSGEGLHMGHLRPYVAGDVYSRHLRMCGYEVMYPIGWDAFGLPAENYAIKNGIQPSISTARNVKNAKQQLKSWGMGFDWSREINTTDPNYYKWTQWIFLQLWKAGLAYEATGLINWCPKDKTGLANEEVINGCCERCGALVEKKEMRQWYLKITAYAEKLLEGLKTLDWPEKIKVQQENWIGRSEGAEIDFEVAGQKPKKVILMHGKDANPDEKWYPWLAEEVQERCTKFIAPRLPESDNPELEAWLREIEKANPDEDTILIGHSRGGVAILRWLENLRSGKVVKKVIIVASDRGDAKKESRGFFGKPYDFKKIRSHCDSFVVLHSRDDEWVPFEAGEYIAKNLNANFLIFDGRGHFGKKLPKQEISELVGEIFPSIKVFTTRPDTLFGATYMVLSPEHELILKIKNQILNWGEVEKYIKVAQGKSEEERIAEGKEKTGVELKGIKAINPATKEEVPIWVADYVLAGYGTGAIMAVPAHDERDFEFAKRYKLPIREVIAPLFIEKGGLDAWRETGVTKKRNTVSCIIKHWSEDKYLCLRWVHDNWRGFVIGGVEGGEDIIEAACREIREETGFKNVKFIKVLGNEIHYKFFASHKNENRWNVGHGIYFELLNGESDEISEQEKKLHSVVWIDKDKVADFIANDPSDSLLWERLNGVSRPFIEEGVLVGSDKFTGMNSEKAKWEITKLVGGKKQIQYRLRDWVFSRQRYWGEPIPLVHCAKCGIVPVPEEELPLKLPEVEKYEPTGTGESPLAAVDSWVNTKCPECGGRAKRETNTMPQWAGSSWYYLAYIMRGISPPAPTLRRAGNFPAKGEASQELQFPISKYQEAFRHWLPVDVYFGGMEHTTLHLLYSRFWHQFLYDKKFVPTPEPYLRRVPHGIILGPDGEKMSKSRGNIVSPDEIVKNFGADCLRMYELFLGPHEATVSWKSEGILGISRFLERVWKFYGVIANNANHGQNNANVTRNLQRTIKKDH